MRLHMVPNSHIDPVWLWDKYEGIDEVLNTFRSACNRLDEYPDLTFSASSLQFYEWAMKYDKPLFKRIRERIDEGRWEVCGGWWVEPDTNLPLESSFRKHAKLSSAFARKHLGVDIVTAYVPDTFGHPTTLPKILAETGFKYFIFCRPQQQEKADLPGNLFRWTYEGHSVLAYRLKHHYGQWHWVPEDKIPEMLEDEEYQNQAANCYLFGVGDHGGGPAIEEIEFYNRYMAGKTSEEIGYSTCERFFREADSIPNIPEYSGDLHFHAIGCYSVLSDIKRGMRESEELLGYAERALSMGGADSTGLEEPWKTTLFNQFHDILPGSCSPEAADNAVEELGSVKSLCKDAAYAALKTVSLQTPPEVREGEFRIFNTLPFDVTAPLSVESMVYYRENAAFMDSDGQAIEIQQALPSVRAMNRKWEFIDTIPANSFKRYHFNNDVPAQRPDRDSVQFAAVSSETAAEFLRQLQGTIQFLVLDDPTDTWGHGVSKYDSVEGCFELQASSMVTGPVSQQLCQQYTWNKSSLDVIYSSYRNTPGIYLDVKVQWAERRKILKMELQPNQEGNGKLLMQCAGGTAQRPDNGTELPLHSWLWTSMGDTGTAVIQKGAFACDALGSRLRFTLVRSSFYGYHAPPAELNEADPQLDTDMGNHTFKMLILPAVAYDQERFDQLSQILYEPFTTIRES